MSKKYSWSKIVAVVLCVVILLYMTYNAFAYTYSPISTQRLTEETSFEQTFEFTGFVLRDETTIDAATSGTVISLAVDSTRVAKGDCIAVSCNTDEEASVYTRLQAAKEEYERLLQIDNQSGVNELDSEKLNEGIRQSYTELMDKIFTGNYSSIEDSLEEINSKSATKQILSNGSIDLSGALSGLQAEIDTLENKNVKYTEIEAPASGYYINNLDGYESALNYHEVMSLTPEQIENAIKSQPKQQPSKSGKLVSSYQWFVVGLVEANQPEKFSAGKSITVNFPDEGLYDIQMKVESAEVSGEKLKVILSSTLMNEALANIRIEKVQVVEKSFNGFKIPSKAIRFDKENNSGVYVLRGKIISFIPVEILHTDDDYVIVSSSKTGGKGLTLYDDVITKGRDIHDGKVIN